MNKYGPKAQKKVEKTMEEFKEGDLKSGKSGKKVTSRKQAVAIGSIQGPQRRSQSTQEAKITAKEALYG